jgi:hypothetical protein
MKEDVEVDDAEDVDAREDVDVTDDVPTEDTAEDDRLDGADTSVV